MIRSQFYEAESRKYLPVKASVAALPPAGAPAAAAAGARARPSLPPGGISLAIPDAALDRYLERWRSELGEDVVRAWFDMRAEPSHARVEYLLELSRREDELEITPESSDLFGIPFMLACATMEELIKRAERAFRLDPSSDNYARLYAERVLGDSLGLEDLGPFFCNYRSRGGRIHVIRPGDWLSKLAARYYGNKNLWDVIYEYRLNHLARVHHPDRLLPGWRVVIP